MKAFTLFLATAAVVFATQYRLQVYAPETEIHGQEVNAGSQAFYLNIEALTYCPPFVGEECPPNLGTLVHEGFRQMAVMVPGGQSTYVSPDGSVHYTQAHSTIVPPGSFMDGFHNITMTTGSRCGMNNISLLTFTPSDCPTIGGFFACPGVPDYMASLGATYQIYVRTPEFDRDDCIQMDGLLELGTETLVGAWQYT